MSQIFGYNIKSATLVRIQYCVIHKLKFSVSLIVSLLKLHDSCVPQDHGEPRSSLLFTCGKGNFNHDLKNFIYIYIVSNIQL